MATTQDLTDTSANGPTPHTTLQSLYGEMIDNAITWHYFTIFILFLLTDDMATKDISYSSVLFSVQMFYVWHNNY